MQTQIPDELKGYKAIQNPDHIMTNRIEIEGILFAVSFVLDYPQSARNIIEGERARKETLAKMEEYNKEAERLRKEAQISYGEGFKMGAAVAKSTEGFIPLERIALAMRKPDNRGKHMQTILLMLHTCMTEKGHTVAYYCSVPVKDIKAKFTKVLDDLHISNAFYDETMENELPFSSGSKIVFVSSVACGDFHTVAPAEPQYIGMDLGRVESRYNKYVAGTWNP